MTDHAELIELARLDHTSIDHISVEGADLTVVRGIGPVYAVRLHRIGVTSYGDLAEGNAAAISQQIDVPEDTVADWIDQAATLT